jgi:adenine deaminase
VNNTESTVKKVSGNIVDILNASIYPCTLKIVNGKIAEIIENPHRYETYLVPGLVDAHIHIESSLLPPSEFARVAAIHGTVATVSDPHEIANVLGIAGVTYMVENASTAKVKFYFGAPSCVPASVFETSGASLNAEEVGKILKWDQIKFLGEAMNVPAVLNGDSQMMKKIQFARQHSKVIDGHAPGLQGKDLEKYIQAGISTDHECIDRDEALEKIRLGMKILIREGSAARNFDELLPLIEEYPESCMFCSDDKHPDDLIEGHINDLIRMALRSGLDIMKVLKVACVNPVLHYRLDVGLLRKGDPADFLVIDNLKDFRVLKTYIEGEVVAEEGTPLIPRITPRIVNNFTIREKAVSDFTLPAQKGNIRVIEIIEGQLITEKGTAVPKVIKGYVVPDIEKDILKIVVVNRYQDVPVAIGFIRNFGLKKGAIASSVAHDSHNIIAVGVTDGDICRAVNAIIKHKGGISAVSGERDLILPLPIAGIMSDEDYTQVARQYRTLDNAAKSLGSPLQAPFMTLSFMALPVIPHLKLSDRGLFDGDRFHFVSVFEEA